VHILVIYILQVHLELAAACAQVAFLEDVQVVVLIDQHPHPDVELSVEDQKWPLYVLLDDEGVVLDFVCIFRLLLRRRSSYFLAEYRVGLVLLS